jgi:hypothetical protein
MKTASQMSKEIRAKKKAMKDRMDVVDLSGIPMDKTDEDIMDRDQMTSELGLDTNHSRMRDEEPTAQQELMADAHDRAHEAEAPDSKRIRMMAEGGQVKAMVEPQEEPEAEYAHQPPPAHINTKDLHDDRLDHPMKAPKALPMARLTPQMGMKSEMEAEHGEGGQDEAKMKRKARLMKAMR